MKKHLVIIPGLGDRSRAYSLFWLVWKLYGFNVHIYTFGWVHDTADFEAKTTQMLEYLDSIPSKQVRVIGVSAGGTAAVHALIRRPEKISRVVAVATPLTKIGDFHNKLLLTSMKRVEKELPEQPDDIKQRILSVYGRADKHVIPRHSQPDGVHLKQLGLSGHIVVIFWAMTFGARPIRAFLK